ncbi:MAG: biosynthetic arginine decarboxylase [Gammaproteobacteria bacterium]|uniref:biosynthetic arginine decarboxylase n=1 Tax=Shewanella TaxID=22 RepID=UPI000CA1C1FE|nr:MULTISPECIES: biosynthetic arginine decarboxylase [unclassified Shewanella]EGT3625711.1 biosynthetic arginine decarboxylase [Morganella morganii]MBU1390932.1 biosynthetic arginine decarboxylase [Gammaproteobacteria bacterium]QYX66463.1 biosynthetic arginine decarboxylase [Shewanella putrefaciens]AUD60078.1 arginine decarboxylase [Shewanella sp. Pdp11]MBU1476155.1 biosynthetic arginine decarboxylase [Gammaproteobacteria bacterium]
MNDWSIDDARAGYNVTHWSQGFYGISDHGEVTVSPDPKNPDYKIGLNELAKDMVKAGVALPVLVRFPQILHHRVNSLCQAFDQAIQKYEYQADYLLVYPIKVNQQQTVVEEILASQASKEVPQLGLEAGSKPELMAVLAMAQKASSVIVCNGYKDNEYIRLALIGEKLGHKVYIVLEKLSELKMVLAESKRLGVKPRLGLRARLAFQGKGKWQASGGEKSKFGLSAAQILLVVEQLKQHDMLDSLQLLHFHLGSQIANIRDIRQGVSEAGRFYCELRELGASVNCFDVGGGLAVDYDGTRSQSNNSMNYGLTEYANNIVNVLTDICNEYEQPMPRIISESGRYLTAHHAVLITDVIGTEAYQPEDIQAPAEESPQLLHNMWHSWSEISGRADQRALIEIYHDSQSDLQEAHSLFALGQLSLAERAWAEQANLRVCHEVQGLLSAKNRYHRPIIDELNEKLADKFFVNFSLFQSLPDAWGIDQVFPVLPLSGLDKAPERRAVMLDITCDSDGIVDQYVDGQGIETTLPVPAWSADSPYLIGFFLVGAYQEILGDMHNLFGDTNSAVVRIEDNGVTNIESVLAGDTVADVLRYVNLDAVAFMRTYEELVNLHIAEDERAQILEELQVGLKGYTYLEDFS